MNGTIYGGRAVTELTCETAMNIGRAAAALIYEKTGRSPRIVTGSDTRMSAEALCMALAAGIISAGGSAVKLRTVPLPAAVLAARELSGDCLIMLSPSGRSFEYNEIRLFSPDGGVLPEDMAERIQKLVQDEPHMLAGYLKGGRDIGSLIDFGGWKDGYINKLLKSGGSSFPGMRIAADCANGSVSVTAEKLFADMGAKVYLLGCDPNGKNIEEKCGVTCMDSLAGFVLEKNCDVGFAFDGSGEKCLAVDETGAVIDGDQLMAIFAADMKKRDKLTGDTAVISASANLGFSFFARERGIKTVTAKAGGEYITEQLRAGGYALGGEQNGRIIFGNLMPVSDGQLTALRLLSVMKREGKKLSELAAVIKRYPRVIINVKITPDKRETWKNIREIEKVIEKCEQELGDSGRVLVRESSCEPVIRVMAECESFSKANEIAIRIADTVKECCRR